MRNKLKPGLKNKYNPFVRLICFLFKRLAMKEAQRIVFQEEKQQQKNFAFFGLTWQFLCKAEIVKCCLFECIVCALKLM